MIEVVLGIVSNPLSGFEDVSYELRRRKKSRKARKRLVQSILRRRRPNGVFERRVMFLNFLKLVVEPIRTNIGYTGIIRQALVVEKMAPDYEEGGTNV